MEKFAVDSKYFKYNKLEVCPAGVFRGIRLYLDNIEVKLKKGKAILPDDNGVERAVAMTRNIYDDLWVEVEGEKYYPIGRLTPFEKIMVFAPYVLMFIGGAIGGLLGAFASYTNTNLVREFKDSSFKKYGLCLVSTSLAFLILVVSSVAVNMMMGR